MDKPEAVWQWLFECSEITDLYFNFSQSNNGDTVLIPITAYNDSWQENMPFIDGSGYKNYDFAISHFAPISLTPNSNENIDILLKFEKIAEWIDEQGKVGNYPKFPQNCSIQELYTLPTETGYVTGQDEKGAKYMLQFRIEYIYEGD